MLAQKLILSYSTKIIVQFVQIVASIIVARVAGPTVLGTVAFGTAYVSMFMFIADLGIGTAHIKLLSEGRDEATCIGTYAGLKIFLTMLFCLVVLGVFFVQKFGFNNIFESSIHEKVILISLISITISQLFQIPQVTFAARTEQAKQDIPNFVKTLLYQILRIIVVLLGYRALTIAFSNLVATIVVIPIYIILFRKYKIGKFDRELAKQYLKISLPLIVIVICQTLIHWTDKVILQYLTNSKEVGYYVAGFKIGGFIFMIGNSVGMLFFPIFSKAISQEKYVEINSKISKFERFSLLFVFPVTVFCSIYADLIVKFILGDRYTNSILILAIINISMFIMVFRQPYGNVLSGKVLIKKYCAIRSTSGRSKFMYLAPLFEERR